MYVKFKKSGTRTVSGKSYRYSHCFWKILQVRKHAFAGAAMDVVGVILIGGLHSIKIHL
jgi:hypothetical protein